MTSRPYGWLIGLGLGLIGLGLLLMRGLAGTRWTHLTLGMAIAGAGSGLVNPPLASTAVGVVQPPDAGMASGINSTFRQIGIATSVAVLGSIFDSKIAGATAARATGHYASALNEVLLIAACIAFAAGALALVLIRSKDFHAPRPRCAAARACGRKPQLIPKSDWSNKCNSKTGLENQLTLGFVLNCVVLWDDRLPGRRRPGHLRAQGYPVRGEDVARLSPFVSRHLGVHGSYTFDLADLAPGAIRELRDPDAPDEDNEWASLAGRPAPAR